MRYQRHQPEVGNGAAMESRGNTATAAGRSLSEAIRQARLKEAVALDETADRRSAELARLEVLKAGLVRLFDEIPDGDDRFELMLVPSQPARLWIDIFTYVTVDPPSRTYRLVRNGRQGRRVLAETHDAAEMTEHVVDYVAQQIVAREREMDGFDLLARHRTPAAPAPAKGARLGIVVAAYVVGLLTGVVGLLAIGYLITP